MVSTTASGNATQVRDQLTKYGEQFVGAGANATSDAQKRTVDAAGAAVEKLTDGFPDNTSFSVKVDGSASESGSGSLSISISASQAPIGRSSAQAASGATAQRAATAGAGSTAAPGAAAASRDAGSVQQPASTGTTAPQSGSLTGATVTGASQG